MKRKLVLDITESVCLNDLINEEKECSKNGNSNVSFSNICHWLSSVSNSFPYEYLVQFTGRAHSKKDPAMEKVLRTHPECTHTFQLRQILSGRAHFYHKERHPKPNQSYRQTHPYRAFTPYISCIRSWPCRTKITLSILSGSGWSPSRQLCSHFSFQLSYLWAFKNELNIKR